MIFEKALGLMIFCKYFRIFSNRPSFICLYNLPKGKGIISSSISSKSSVQLRTKFSKIRRPKISCSDGPIFIDLKKFLSMILWRLKSISICSAIVKSVKFSRFRNSCPKLKKLLNSQAVGCNLQESVFSEIPDNLKVNSVFQDWFLRNS